MKEIELRIKMTVDDDFIDKAKNWEHHADYLLDLDSYPEIKNVYDCHVIEIIDAASNKMTKEQQQKLCDIYNEKGIADALAYMSEFLKDNHNPAMLNILDRINTLYTETTLGNGREDYTKEEYDEYNFGKAILFNYFDVKNNNGHLFVTENRKDTVSCTNVTPTIAERHI